MSLTSSSSAVSARHDCLARYSTHHRTARLHICLGSTPSTTIRSTHSHTLRIPELNAPIQDGCVVSIIPVSLWLMPSTVRNEAFFLVDGENLDKYNCPLYGWYLTKGE